MKPNTVTSLSSLLLVVWQVGALPVSASSAYDSKKAWSSLLYLLPHTLYLLTYLYFICAETGPLIGRPAWRCRRPAAWLGGWARGPPPRTPSPRPSPRPWRSPGRCSKPGTWAAFRSEKTALTCSFFKNDVQAMFLKLSFFQGYEIHGRVIQ